MFFRYLLHVEGGCHSNEQALIQTRQVNMLLDGIDPEGDDLNCLVRNDGLDIWDMSWTKTDLKRADREHPQGLYQKPGAASQLHF